MTANRYIGLLSEMGIVLSHSRPRVSNDNAFSEAQFKTQKYQPDYPGLFEHTAHGRSWCASYFDWYNFDHHHTGPGRLHPRGGVHRSIPRRGRAQTAHVKMPAMHKTPSAL
jgi:putative transposase